MTRVAFLCDKLGMKGIAERLKIARTNAGYRSASAAAVENNWTISTYRAHENGQNNFGFDDAITYGRAFNVAATWLCGYGSEDDVLPFAPYEVPGYQIRTIDLGTAKAPARAFVEGGPLDFIQKSKKKELESIEASQEKRSPSIELSQPDELSNLSADVPVYGTAMGGDGDEDFNLNGDVVNYVRRPHGIAKMRGVFAIYVQGDSMSPRHRAGELRYATSAQSPGIGDDIILEIFDNFGSHGDNSEPYSRGILKELVRRTSTSYVVRQHNPEREFTIDRSRIKRVFRVLTLNDLLG